MIFTELQNLIKLDVLKADHLKTLFNVKDRQKISIMDQHSCVCDESRKLCKHAWAPADIFPEGAKPPTVLKVDVFGAPCKQSTIFRRAEGANENFCVFATF